MASSSHVALRLAALALLVAVGLWPRSHPSNANANANANANTRSATQERAHELVRTTTPHVLEGAARAVRRQPPAVEVLADADESPLVN